MFHVPNLSVRNFRIFRLMYTGSRCVIAFRRTSLHGHMTGVSVGLVTSLVLYNRNSPVTISQPDTIPEKRHLLTAVLILCVNLNMGSDSHISSSDSFQRILTNARMVCAFKELILMVSSVRF